MDYLIVKLYLNEIDEDCHDLHISDQEARYQEFSKYAETIGKQLFFMPVANDPRVGLPVCGTPFAEVEYSGELDAREKQEIVEYLKKFSLDATVKKGRLYEFPSLAMVKFKKTEDEVLVLR